jgi:hypothetical protein
MIVVQRYLCLIGLFSLLSNLQVQAQANVYNNFEDSDMLDIIIDASSNQANVWQIGQPGKVSFNGALSSPNVIITDTVNTYPTNLNSSFYFKVAMDIFWADLPYFVLHWDQKLDCELGVDGGIIEVSYDSMNTWINIFEDEVHNAMPMKLEPDLLDNGELGLSRISSDWELPFICWSEASVGSDFDKDKVFIRFTFISDDTDTEQEGWMIDNFEAYSSLVDNVEDLNNRRLPNFDVYPNPAGNLLFVSADVDVFKSYKIYDLKGHTILEGSFDTSKAEIDLGNLESGIYMIQMQGKQGGYRNHKFIKK